MHPLVHAWTKDRLQADLQIPAWAATASILSLSIENDYGYREYLNKIQTHIEFCLSLQPQDLFTIDQYPPLEICRIFYSFTWLLYRLKNDDTADEYSLVEDRTRDSTTVMELATPQIFSRYMPNPVKEI
jgi:hypothetical protein